MWLFDLEVDSLYPASAALDLNPAQVRLKVVQDALGFLQKPLQSEGEKNQL